MKIYKGQQKYFFIILGIIASLFLLIVFKNPIINFANTITGGRFLAETVTPNLDTLYFVGYEGTNMADENLKDMDYDDEFNEYYYDMHIFEDDSEIELKYTPKYSGASVTVNPSTMPDPANCTDSSGCLITITSTAGGDTATYYITVIADMDFDRADNIVTTITTSTAGTGQYYEYIVPRSGTYKIEAWGAPGGYGCDLDGTGACSGSHYDSGYGAYTAGTITLVGGTKFYIFLGAAGSSPQKGQQWWAGGWNGGGQGVKGSGNRASGSGGGATDIRTVPTSKKTIWNETASLNSRIMVAAGGGGGSYDQSVATWSTHGGGLYVEGLSTTRCSANQSDGFGFGQGMGGTPGATVPVAGSGGGWYGGSGYIYGSIGNSGSGCGGSSYISGHLGSIGVDSTGAPKSTEQVGSEKNESYSSSGYVFTDTVMVDGYGHAWTTEPTDMNQTAILNGMPSASIANGTTQGNLGGGVVRITQTAKYSRLDNKLKTLSISAGSLSPAFDPEVFDYELTLDTFDNSVTAVGTVNNLATTAVTESQTINIDVGQTKSILIFVTDIASGATNTYNITVTRPVLPTGAHSTYIEKIDNPNNDTIYIDRGVYTYSLPIRYGKMSVDLGVHLYDPDATYTITGADFMLNNTGVITIKVTDPAATPSETTYTFNYTRETSVGAVEDVYHFYYTGAPQEFIIPVTGDYKFEAWGGAGGTMQGGWTGKGGRGAYVSGEINMIQGTKLYLYVGGRGTGYYGGGTKAGGWNGGGSQYSGASGGGGATDIRLINATWNDIKSLNSRILVAGGGGGSNDSTNGGYGGALVGGTGANGSSTNGSGGSQVIGGDGIVKGQFGAGANSLEANTVDGGAGGGGYYGGGKANGYNTAGGGGSSFISGYKGAVAVSSASNTMPRRDADGETCTALSAQDDITCSYHYSGHVFTKTEMIAGNSTQPNYDGTDTQVGNDATGHIKITPLSTRSENNFLENLTFDAGTRNPVQFASNIYEYEITVSMYTQFITLEGIPYDPTAEVIGDGKKLLEIGDNPYDIVVTAENGETRTYHVNVVREGLKGTHSNAINNIYIDGYGYIYPERNVYTYNFVLQYNKYEAVMNIKLYDPDAEYTVTGADLLVANSGSIIIEVTHPDGSVPPLTYRLNYTRQIPLYDIEGTYLYTCTKSEAEFIAPLDGEYIFEAWGAAGGGGTSDYYSGSHGGRGGYSQGTITLEQGDRIFINVGCAGSYASGLNQGGGWNGGGHGGGGGYGGGGATDFRFKGNTLARRIMVAGGGGGADNAGASRGGGDDGSGGVGGGLEGEDAYINGAIQPNTGGTQTSGFQLGVGQSVTRNTDTGGAGGGYWGGKVTNNNNGGAGGGSGYVDMEYFPDGRTIAGNNSFHSIDGESYEFGHPGDGNAKITVTSYLSENYYLESLTTDTGTWNIAFDPATKDYEITIDTYTNFITFTATAYDQYAVVKGDGTHEADIGDNYFPITVTAQNGSVRTYNIKVIRTPISSGEKTAELQKIKIEGLPDIICETGVYNYELTIPETWFYLDVRAIAYDSRSTQRYKGFTYIPESGTATITSRVSGGTTRTYTIKIIKGNVDTIFTYDYNYTGDYQVFTAPMKGYYTFEVWGAQGGTRGGLGGRGGYATGRLLMEKDQTVYIYVGGSGNSGGTNGGWNGGGSRATFAGGGGASDVRTEIGDLYTRFIVAGGGGSVGSSNRKGGDGGGLNGENRYQSYGWGGTGGSQTSGGAGSHAANAGTFGQGGYGYYYAGGYAGAGGGGWYGGGGSHPDGSADDDRGGGGGSGFVLTENSVGNTPVGYKLSEDYFLKDAKLIAGWDPMPNPDSNGTMVGRYGNGFARVRLSVLSDNNFLSKLNIKNHDEVVSYSPNFDVETQEYTVNLDTNQTVVTIQARPDDSTATIKGLGDYDIPVGSTTIPILVTSESGKDRTYNITFNREASTDIEPEYIKIVGLADLYCNKHPLYCLLDPVAEFDKDVHDYTMTVPFQIRQLDFQVHKANENQVVKGGGRVSLDDITTNISIEVQSEECAIAGDTSAACTSVYNYSITRDMASDADLMKLVVTSPPNTSLLFDRDVIEYTLSVPYEYRSLGLDIETDCNGATYVIDGNENFELGWNRVTITVTALDGTTKIYGLSVYREKDDSTFLSSIFVTSGEGETQQTYLSKPDFNRLNLGFYDYVVPNDITEIDVVGIAEAPTLSTVTYSVSGGTSVIDPTTGHVSNMATGYTFVNITVTAQDGSKDTYKLRIFREKNGDSSLKSLSVSVGGNPMDLNSILGVGFDPTQLTYDVTVPIGTQSLDISAIPNMATSNVTITGNTLAPGKVTNVYITVTAENGTKTVYTLQVFRPASTNNILSGLQLRKFDTDSNDYVIDVPYTPAFDTAVLEYSTSVPNEVDKIKIIGSIGDPYATIVNNGGVHALAVGLNKIELEVMSESGTINTYVISITRAPNSNPYLKTLTADDGSVVVMTDHATTTYELNVRADVMDLHFVDAVPEASTTTWTTLLESNPLTATAPNTFIVMTTAEDGVTSKQYTINVIRDKSNNTNLDWLLLHEGALSPKFDPYTITYEAYVPYDATSGVLDIVLEDNRSSYTVTPNINNLVVGDNVVVVTVTAESGDTKDYTITIHRQELEASNNKLFSLTVNRGTLVPAFDKDVPYYEVTVPYETEDITVSADPIDTTDAQVTGTGKYSLEVGRNVIVVKVFSSDNKERDYQILVTRRPSTEARLRSLVLDGVLLSPPFNPDTYYYEVTTQEKSLKFREIVPMFKDATYQINGNYFDDLSGTYTVTIVVTAADKTTQKEYTIKVFKEPSMNAYLRYLAVEGYELRPGFNKGTSVYTVEVPEGVLSVNVLAVADNVEATIDGAGIRLLNSGSTTIPVRVTSGAGVEYTYTILVRRPVSSDSSLEVLQINNGTMAPAFSPTILEYDVTIPYDATDLDIVYRAKYDTSIVGISDRDFTTASSKDVVITVTAEDGSVTRYILHVTKAPIISALIKELEFEDYLLDPFFDPNVFDYYLYQNNEDTSVTIEKLITLDEHATVSYDASLLSGHTVDNMIYDIPITVTASDGSDTKVYTIHVYHQEFIDNFLTYISYCTDFYDDGECKDTLNVIPTFDRTVSTYSINLPNEISEIKLKADARNDINVTMAAATSRAHYLSTGFTNFRFDTGSSTVQVQGEKNGIKRTYKIHVNRSMSSDNTLHDIRLIYEGKDYSSDLVPDFDPATLDYNLTVDIGTAYLDVTAYIADSALVSGDGRQTINVGDTDLTIVVTAENGDVKTYRIRVHKEPSSDNTLIELIPSDGDLDPEFEPNTLTYNLTLNSGVGTLSFDARTTDRTATITGLDADIVNDGDSTRTIVVTSEQGVSKTYTINIHKYSNNNAYLKSLQIGSLELTPTFDKTVNVYQVTVPNSMKIVKASDVSAVPEDGSATVTKTSQITTSTTAYTDYAILVTGGDGVTTNTYHLQIIRELGSTTTLSKLSTNSGYLKPSPFAPKTFEYTYMIPTSQVQVSIDDFKYTPTDEKATVTYDAPIDLTDPSIDLTDPDHPVIFTIRVTAEDLSGYSEYKITLKWDFNSVNTLASLNVQKGYMVQQFKPGLYKYDVYEYFDELTDIVTATTTSEKATITSGVGAVDLTQDREFFHYIDVEAEDGQILQYIIHFHVLYKRDTNLLSFALEGTSAVECDETECFLVPTFDGDVIEYDIHVPYDYILLDWDYTLMNNEQTAKFIIDGKEVKDRTYKLPIAATTDLTIEVYDGLKHLTQTYTVHITRNQSDNAFLSALSVAHVDNPKNLYTLTPAFNTNIYEYQIDVDKETDEVLMMGKTSDENARVKFNGYNYLFEGDNKATATVTAPDGTVKTYVVHIIKEPQYNSWLKDISVSTGQFWDLTPNFRKTVFNYTLKLSGEIDEVYVDATPDATTTTVRGTGTYEIGLGMTVINLTGTAIDGSTSVYQIGIIQDASNEVDLKSLDVEGYPTLSPKFDPSVIHYTLKVDEDTTDLNITAIPKDPKARVFILGNTGLMTGNNTVSVQVLSQSRVVTKTYSIDVIKPLSHNANLSGISVYDIVNVPNEEGGTTPVKTYHDVTPEFDSKQTNYKVKVPYSVEDIYVEYSKAFPMARVSGGGYYALNYGVNNITLTVTAEDGVATKEYNLEIYREYNLFLEKIEFSNGVGPTVPEFNRTQREYVLTVPNSVRQVYIKGTPEDTENVTVNGNSTYPSATGILPTSEPTTAVLTLTAADGNTSSYSIKIVREKNNNPDATMISLAEGSLTPAFDKDTLSYTAHVHPTVLNGSATFTVNPREPTTTHKITGNSNLKMGSNNVSIEMTAEDGTKKTYTFEIIVEEEAYFSNKLIGLKIEYPADTSYQIQLIPDFDSLKNSYSASVANSIDQIDIQVTGDANTNVTGQYGLQSVNVGRNVYQITVTNSVDSSIPANVYTIVIYRLEDNANLASLVAVNHPFVFAQSVTEYSIDVGDEEDSLRLTAIPVDPNSQVDIVGNADFVIGNNDVTIKVTSPMGTEKTYTIHVRRAASNNPFLSSLTVEGYEYAPTFDPTASQTYRLTVPANTNSVLIKGVTQKTGTTCTNLGATNLTFGTNNVTITCTAGDGRTTHDYKLSIIREASSENRLLSLTTSPKPLNETFNEDITDYTVTLGEYDGRNVRISAVAKDVDCTIDGLGEYYLNEKYTKIPITITAPDGSKMVYNITVEIFIDTTPTLADLWVEEGQISPTFNSRVQVYSLHVPYEVENATVRYRTTNDGSIVHVTGAENLEVKTNEVTVTVISRDGSETYEYTIYVIRDPYASNLLSRLTVKGDNGVTYPLDPAFSSDRLYYEVTVPNSVTRATISARSEDATATVVGARQYGLNIGANTAYILVTSANNYTRTYTVVITRQSEAATGSLSYLTSLTEDVPDAELTPTFDPAVTSYNITVPSELGFITLNGTAAPGASVQGFGKSILKYGTNQRTITVTGSDGSKTVYYVYITRPYTNYTSVTSITPSVGTLNYVDGETEFDMSVEATTASISFAVVTADPLATVKGNGDTPLVSGKNIITITITGTNGEEREIHIFVNKSTAITGIDLEKHSIILGVGEQISIDYDFTPVDTAYTAVTWSIDTTDYAEVAVNGLITGKSPGTAKVTITSDFDSNVKDTVTVKVIYKDIRVTETSGYEVGKKDTNKGYEKNYIRKITAGVSIKDFMKEIKNNAEYIHIYDNTLAELNKNDTGVVKTGYIVRLIVDDQILDEALVCVMGDSSGDGLVTAVDVGQVKNAIANPTTLQWYQRIAIDMNYDDLMTAVDTAQVKLAV